MNNKNEIAKNEKMPIEEKLKKLSETDLAYIKGFVDRAYIETIQKKDEICTKRQKNE